jgi:hypothetical protein
MTHWTRRRRPRSNKANSRTTAVGQGRQDCQYRRGTDRAKQTQFLREWNDVQVLLRKETMTNLANQRPQKNKANFPVTAGTAVVLGPQTR